VVAVSVGERDPGARERVVVAVAVGIAPRRERVADREPEPRVGVADGLSVPAVI